MRLIFEAFRKDQVYDYFIENEKKIEEFNRRHNVVLEDICWIYTNKLANYKKFRIFYKMWRTIKSMSCVLAFYPSKLLNSKKGKLIRKLINVKSGGSTFRSFK